MRRKNNYVMMRLDTLPNGRKFVAWYKRVSRSTLPANIVIERKYTQKAVPKNKRRWQHVAGFLDIAKKSIGKTAFKNLPKPYVAATSRIENDKIRRGATIGHSKMSLKGEMYEGK